MDHELSINLILTSLSASFSPFVLNYRMNNTEFTIPELINMLRVVEPSLKIEGKVMMLMEPSGSKRFLRTRRSLLRQREVWLRIRPKRQPQKGLASIMVRVATGGGTARPIWSP